MSTGTTTQRGPNKAEKSPNDNTTLKDTSKTPQKELSYFESLLSPNPDKRLAELFFWKWHIFWLAWFGGIVVLKTYETFTATSYMKVGLIVGIPPMILPLLFPALSGEQHLPWHKRYTTKLNLYNWIVAYVGNYWWTHYFYHVLGTSYTLPAHCLNGVPFALYLITHSYFLLYHSVGAICVRAFWRKIAGYSKPVRWTLCVALYLFMGYVTAVIEVASIASFPYYTYPDTWRMWVIGSGFYGIYFLISYPLYAWIDDDCKNAHESKNDLLQIGILAMAYGMVTTFMLDAWRLSFGALNEEYQNIQHAVCHSWTEWDW